MGTSQTSIAPNFSRYGAPTALSSDEAMHPCGAKCRRHPQGIYRKDVVGHRLEIQKFVEGPDGVIETKGRFYSAVVLAYCEDEMSENFTRHHVRYDEDGEEEWLSLFKEEVIHWFDDEKEGGPKKHQPAAAGARKPEEGEAGPLAPEATPPPGAARAMTPLEGSLAALESMPLGLGSGATRTAPPVKRAKRSYDDDETAAPATAPKQAAKKKVGADAACVHRPLCMTPPLPLDARRRLAPGRPSRPRSRAARQCQSCRMPH